MKANTKKTLQMYFEHSGKYRISMWLAAASVAGASLVNVIVPLYYKRLFDLLAVEAGRQALVGHVLAVLFAVALLQLLQWAFWRVATFTSSYFESSVMADLSNRCFQYLHKHSFSFFENNFVGSLVKRVKWFTNAFETIADSMIWELLPLAVNIGAIIIVLLYRNILLGFGMMAWIAVFIAVNAVFTRYKLRYDVQRTEAETKSTALLADTVTNHSVIQLFTGYHREVKRFADASEDVRRLRRFTWDLGNTFEAVQGFLMIVLEIGMIYIAIRLWAKGLLTIGDFVLIQSYIINIFMRVWDFGKVIRRMYESLADAEEMTAILVAPHEIQDVRGAKELMVSQGAIEFRDVDFYYHQTRKILKDFSLTIKPHEHVALIGPSGAGKSTIVKLILRMHDVTGGKILIDGQNIAHVTQESLWAHVSYVPQDPILFHRSLMENIRYGKPEASDEEVIEASRAAHCHEFIMSFADGYDTYVGERGIKLSGGERQRVAIARAILRNTPILVLDEATSSLDSESERLIQDALERLMKGRTVIVIAHRLSTIRKMDRIIVVDDGAVVEEGGHEALTKKQGGIYKRLWELQAGGFIQ